MCQLQKVCFVVVCDFFFFFFADVFLYFLVSHLRNSQKRHQAATFTAKLVSLIPSFYLLCRRKASLTKLAQIPSFSSFHKQAITSFQTRRDTRHVLRVISSYEKQSEVQREIFVSLLSVRTEIF